MQHQPALVDEAPASVGIPVEHQWVSVNGVSLHVAIAGPADGAPVLLLHGFPDAWFGWRHQLRALAASGFRVFVPDQRGYNLSEKPGDVHAYAMDRLVGDVLGLVQHYGLSEWCLAGHDWGGAVAWSVAHAKPPGLRKMAIVNLPEPKVFLEHVRRPRQAMRSWYMVAFQLPGSTWWLSRRGAAAVERGVVGSARPGAFDGQLDDYRRAWTRPGAMDAMLAWYRAGFRGPQPEVPEAKVAVPTLILWGEQDSYLGAEMIDPSAARCERVDVIRYPSATHWVLHEEPQATSSALVRHFS